MLGVREDVSSVNVVLNSIPANLHLVPCKTIQTPGVGL